MDKMPSRKRKLEQQVGGGCSFTDFHCVICIGILIEPVKLPCHHEFCLNCFKKYLEVTSSTCPMCKMRFSNWVRDRESKGLSIVDADRWKLIQDTFPELVARKLNSQGSCDTTDLPHLARTQRIAEPGEVRAEYEAEMIKYRLEIEREIAQDHDLGRRLVKEELSEGINGEDGVIGSIVPATQTSPTKEQSRLIELYSPIQKTLRGRVVQSPRLKKTPKKSLFKQSNDENLDPEMGPSEDRLQSDYEYAQNLERELNSPLTLRSSRTIEH